MSPACGAIILFNKINYLRTNENIVAPCF